MSGPLVSIIIPTFNRAHLIGETLDSVIAQTYQNWECIVVDDGSTDDTAKVMEAYTAKDSRIQYHHRPPEHKPGGNGARNYGFKMSRGEYVNWFDSDDIMLPDFLEFKVNRCKPLINLVIVSGFEWNEKTNIKKPILLENLNDLFTDYCLWRLKILTPSVMFRKSFLENKILFNEDILRGQETEFFSRIFFQIDPQIVQIENEVLFLYRHHSETKSSRNNLYLPEYKYSQAFIYSANLERAISTNNFMVIDVSIKRVFDVFFMALSQRDMQTYRYIKKRIGRALKRKKILYAMEFELISLLLEHTNKGRYFFKMRWIKKFPQLLF